MRTVFFNGSVAFVIGVALTLSAEGQDRTEPGPTVFKGATTSSPIATGKVVGPNLKPERGVPVQVLGPEGKTFAVTDENGSWSLYNLAPGTYEVKAAPGWTTSTGQQPISFTVKQSGFWEGLFGKKSDKTFFATDMKVDKDSKQ
jgi:hypothetical protein